MKKAISIVMCTVFLFTLCSCGAGYKNAPVSGYNISFDKALRNFANNSGGASYEILWEEDEKDMLNCTLSQAGTYIKFTFMYSDGKLLPMNLDFNGTKYSIVTGDEVTDVIRMIYEG